MIMYTTETLSYIFNSMLRSKSIENDDLVQDGILYDSYRLMTITMDAFSSAINIFTRWSPSICKVVKISPDGIFDYHEKAGAVVSIVRRDDDNDNSIIANQMSSIIVRIASDINNDNDGLDMNSILFETSIKLSKHNMIRIYYQIKSNDLEYFKLKLSAYIYDLINTVNNMIYEEDPGINQLLEIVQNVIDRDIPVNGSIYLLGIEVD